MSKVPGIKRVPGVHLNCEGCLRKEIRNLTTYCGVYQNPYIWYRTSYGCPLHTKTGARYSSDPKSTKTRFGQQKQRR